MGSACLVWGAKALTLLGGSQQGGGVAGGQLWGGKPSADARLVSASMAI